MLTFKNLLQNSQFIKFLASMQHEHSFLDLEPWQQREVISFHNSKELASTPTHNIIVKNILNNIKYTWSNLSIVDEAIIQRELRLAGYEITCYGLNTFPNSVADITLIIKKVEIIPQENPAVKLNYINKIVTAIVDYQYLIMAILLITMLYTGHLSIISGFVVAYIVTAILSFFMHEYAQHNSQYSQSAGTILIKSWFNWPAHILAYLYLPTLPNPTSPYEITAHVLHHRVWKTDVDGIMGSLKENWFKHLCNPVLHASNKNSIELLNEIDLSFYKSKWMFNNFLVANRIYILPIIHLIFILMFGVTAYASYLVFPIWYFVIIVGATSDLFFHSPYQNRTKPKDAPWWTVPIWFNLTYHISHHEKPNILFFGNGWVKYINLQYWIFLLAYTTNRTNSKK
jgi:hypothetical protein